MPNYKVTFVYERRVAMHVEAENEDTISDFVEKNVGFDLLKDHAEFVDEDRTGWGETSMYDVKEVESVTPTMRLVDGELQEI